MSNSLRVVLVLLGLSLFSLAVTGQDIYARLSYLWFFLILSSYVFARNALAGVEVRRRARVQRAQVGQVFEEVFEVHNRSRLPRIWVELSDGSTMPGARGSRVLTLIGGRRTRSYVSRVRLVARGVYPLGPTRLRSGDLFGLFSVQRELPTNDYLTVYPQVVDLADLPNPPGLLPGGEFLRRRTHQITPNASTVREYAHGDPVSRLHWPSTARRNRLMVKEFELDPLAEVWIFVDAEERVRAQLPHTLETDAGSIMFKQAGQARMLPSTEEYAASIAASIGQHYLRAGRSVGLASAGRTLNILPAERGARQLGKIMEAMATLRADGTTPFNDLVLGQARHLPRGSTAYLVSPTMDSEFLSLLEQLRRLGLRPLVVLLDALSFGGGVGSRPLSAKVAALGIPAVCIAEGQTLDTALQGLRQVTLRLQYA